jgi:hypothetical protein
MEFNHDQESRMNTPNVDFCGREEMAGAMLKEVAAVEPSERIRGGPSLKK